MFSKTSRLVQLIGSLCALVAFASCSNLQQGKRLEDDEQTLRALTAERAELVPWTDELEGERLGATITTADGIDRRVSLSPLSFIAGTETQDIAPIYPFLDDFGSLDTTLITADVRTVLNDFCDAINHATPADSFMASGCLYQLALFYRDSNLVLPVVETDAEHEEVQNETFFEAYFYGQPYVTGREYEVPVRFVKRNQHMDLLVYLLKEDGIWKIDALRILHAEQTDGGE